jgi:hypothetical protein
MKVVSCIVWTRPGVRHGLMSTAIEMKYYLDDERWNLGATDIEGHM